MIPIWAWPALGLALIGGLVYLSRHGTLPGAAGGGGEQLSSDAAGLDAMPGGGPGVSDNPIPNPTAFTNAPDSPAPDSSGYSVLAVSNPNLYTASGASATSPSADSGSLPLYGGGRYGTIITTSQPAPSNYGGASAPPPLIAGAGRYGISIIPPSVQQALSSSVSGRRGGTQIL